jgi:ATP/maltotriose-dependent transcriptional regulator MalT
MKELPNPTPARVVLAVYGAALRAEADIAETSAWTRHRTIPAEAAHRDALFAHVKEVTDASLSPELEAMAVTAEAEYLRGGQMDNEHDIWQSAAHAWECIERPYEQAYCCLQRAEALLKAGQSASHATEPLRQSFELALQLGASSLEHHAREVARRSRVSLIQIPAERSARTTPAEELGLTARETDVLRALTQGLTNRDIGKQLFLSHRTVAIYVSNLLGKLNVSTRGQAAAAATRLGLFDDRREEDQ